MPKLIVRRYTPTDHNDVLNLHRSALMATDAWIASGPWDDDLLRIESVYLVPGGTFLVGTQRQAVVAMGAIRPIAPECCELKRMRVHPLHQRLGYGRTMLHALEDFARRHRYAVIRLDTTIRQPAAQRLYESSGYCVTRMIREGYPFETIFYEKQL